MSMCRKIVQLVGELQQSRPPPEHASFLLLLPPTMEVSEDGTHSVHTLSARFSDASAHSVHTLSARFSDASDPYLVSSSGISPPAAAASVPPTRTHRSITGKSTTTEGTRAGGVHDTLGDVEPTMEATRLREREQEAELQRFGEGIVAQSRPPFTDVFRSILSGNAEEVAAACRRAFGSPEDRREEEDMTSSPFSVDPHTGTSPVLFACNMKFVEAVSVMMTFVVGNRSVAPWNALDGCCNAVVFRALIHQQGTIVKIICARFPNMKLELERSVVWRALFLKCPDAVEGVHGVEGIHGLDDAQVTRMRIVT